MRLGAALPLKDLTTGRLTTGGLARNAQALEAIGYESLWTFDAVGRGFMLPDPLIALAAAAVATEHVALGTGVLQMPIRNTPEVAHRVLTLTLLAPDRLLLGVGPGSTRADFDTFGSDFASRFERFEQQWIELRGWLQDGEFGSRSLTPWPAVQGGPTLVLAGWRGQWIERAAAEAGGWIASAVNTDDRELADAIARYRDAGGARAIVTNVQVGPELGPALARLDQLADLGFDDAVVVDMHPTEDRLVAVREARPR